MSGWLILSIQVFCSVAGLALGYRSLPRPGVGPASADRRRAEGMIGALLLFLPSMILFLALPHVVPGWPQAYGATCVDLVRHCMANQLAVSPNLLGGGALEWSLFIALWYWPILLVLVTLGLAIARLGVFAREQA